MVICEHELRRGIFLSLSSCFPRTARHDNLFFPPPPPDPLPPYSWKNSRHASKIRRYRKKVILPHPDEIQFAIPLLSPSISKKQWPIRGQKRTDIGLRFFIPSFSSSSFFLIAISDPEPALLRRIDSVFLLRDGPGFAALVPKFVSTSRTNMIHSYTHIFCAHTRREKSKSILSCRITFPPSSLLLLC